MGENSLYFSPPPRREHSRLEQARREGEGVNYVLAGPGHVFFLSKENSAITTCS